MSISIKINEKMFALPVIIGRDRDTDRIYVKDVNQRRGRLLVGEADSYVLPIHCAFMENESGGVSGINLGPTHGTKLNGIEILAGECFSVDKAANLQLGNNTIKIEPVFPYPFFKLITRLLI